MQEIEKSCYDLISKDLGLKTKLPQCATFYYRNECTDASCLYNILWFHKRNNLADFDNRLYSNALIAVLG